jgi:hypothetical protein
LVSEAAMSLEICTFAQQLRAQSAITNFRKTPESIQAIYLAYLVFCVASVGFGLVNIEQNLDCWLDAWCWYKEPWAFFLFKFAWIGVIVLFALVVICFMEYELWQAQARASRGFRMHKSMVRLLRNCLFCHIFAWGSTLVWRVGLSSHSSYANSNVLEWIVVTNAAGAGYLDVLVWLSFPAVRQRAIDPFCRRFNRWLGVEPRSEPLFHISSSDSLYKPPEYNPMPGRSQPIPEASDSSSDPPSDGTSASDYSNGTFF